MSKAAASKKNAQQNPPESATKQNQNAPLQSPTQPQAQPLDQSQSPSQVQNNRPQIEIHPASSNEQSRVEGDYATKSPTNVNPQHKEEDDDEVPADKDKLVEYLKNKLSKSEMTLTTLYVAIQIEKDKRDKLVKELEDKKDELHEVNQHEDNFLGEKVQDKMTTALKRALEDKVLADQEVEQASGKLDEVEKEIQELDEKIQGIHKEKCQREYDADEAQYKANEQESIADNLKEVIGKLTSENQEKDNNIAELNDEINDMKSVVQMLITAREKLNSYITDETPGQSRENMRNISTPQEGGFTDMVGARSSGQHYVSDEMERGVGRPAKTNRPPADDDFWYADPTVRKAAAAAGVATSEVKRGGYNEPYPWQPKVQNIENINERGGFSKTVEYNAGPPSFRLPNINNPNAKSEYLYKNKEFMDEFGGNAKNVKNKNQNQNQPKKKAY